MKKQNGIALGLPKACIMSLLLLLAAQTISAQTWWNGNISSDWIDGANWSGDVVPLATDDVIIPDVVNDPVIMAGTAAVAKSVTVQSGGSLTIDPMCSLTINGSGPDGIFNDGVIMNRGILSIGSLTSTKLYGIRNIGTFTNDTDGEININRTTSIGLYNYGTFNNAAKIIIGASANVGAYGLQNSVGIFNNNTGGDIIINRSSIYGVLIHSGIFNNAAKIVVGSLANIGYYGIFNRSTFNNYVGGEIAIDRSTEVSLYNHTGTFTNAAKIIIGALQPVGQTGINNESLFNNNTGGEISIDRSTSAGILNSTGTFTNAAKINIGALASVGNFGISTHSIFNNNTGGEISIDRSTSAGLFNDTGTFTNAAKITIGALASVGNYGIDNVSTFNNNTGGEISIDRSTYCGLGNSSGTFDNSSKIIIGFIASVGGYGMQNVGTFNNNTGGDIGIDQTSIGLKNDGVFTNLSKIKIGASLSVGIFGIENYASFTNSAGGELSIDRTANTGIYNRIGSSFSNASKIYLGELANVGSMGIENNATFNNSSCTALIHIFSNSVILNTGTFSNAGNIIEKASGNSSISTNTGIVQNLNGGTFNIGSGNAAITIAGVIWTGCTDSDWATASNWNGLAVPVAIDDVIIPNTTNDPVIMAGTAALAKSVTVQSGGSMTIDASGSLTINGAVAYGIRNQGTVANNGVISIGAVTAGGSDGIQNYGMFSNNTGAEINIDRTTSNGILNQATFSNAAKITIGALAGVGNYGMSSHGTFNNTVGGEISIDRSATMGLYNTSAFTNEGKITIGMGASVGIYGIWHFAGNFNNNPGGEINIDRSSSIGLYNYSGAPGTFTNAAKITIGALGSVGGYGIYNESTFNNNTGGEISIDRSTTTGLEIQNSTFTNAAKITIGTLASVGLYGIRIFGTFNNNAGGEINIDQANYIGLHNNDGTFTNHAKITIGAFASVGEEGLQNNATFYNKTGAEIKIDQSTHFGLLNASGTFNNEAKLLIGAVAIPGNFGLVNDAIFNNNSGSEISIDRSTEVGLLNEATGLFNNAAKINIGTLAAVGFNGLENGATFNNNVGGEISIDQSSDIGLLNYDGIFTNSAKLSIGALASVGDYGIQNAATFNNNACALLHMFAPLNNNNTFTNSGLFSVNTADAHTNTALTNNGIIEYPQGNPIPNVTNNDFIVAPITGECSVIANALQKGSLLSFTAGSTWYTDEALTMPAGTYNQAANTFTVTNLAEGSAYTLYFSIADNINSCPRTVSIEVTYDDVTPPNALCKNAAVEIQTNGSATITPIDIDNNSYDNCSGTLSVSINNAVFTCDNLGANTVILTVTDMSGLSGDCSAAVTVSDPNHYCCAPPEAICQSATVYLDASGVATIEVEDVDGGSTYECGFLSMEVSQTAAACSDIGSPITVTLTVTDVNNISDECMSVVTVLDNLLPTVVCKPATVSLDVSGSGGITTSSVFESGSDNCGTVNQVSVTPSTFNCGNLGANTVTLTVNDGHGNNGTCTATVTVVDNILPTISCPANIAEDNDPNLCSAIVSYSTPAGTDNCSGPATIQTSGLASGSSFPVGVTTNTFQVMDGAGNTATCAFTVTVNDTQLPTITCPANIAVANTTGLCSAVVSYTTPSGTDNCSSPSTIQTAGLPSGASFPVGTTTNTFQVTDGASNTATCAFTVTVNDTQLPTITCPANIAVANTTGQCAATVSYATPVGTDNCSSPTTIQTSGLPSGSSFPVGTTTNTFKVTDGASNTATCAFTVTVSDTQLPTITCPANIAVANTTGQCAATVSYATPVGTDNCSSPTTLQTSGLPSGSSFPVGTTTNTFKVTDGASNTATCAFTVTVSDTQLPTITCPANIAVANTTGQCAATVSYATPVGTDNCSSPTTIQTSGLPSGSSFPVGTTTNTFKVTDGASNTATCAFTVTVSDAQLPTINCPANIAVANTTGQCAATASYATPAGTDNCSSPTTIQTSGLPSGSSFPVGTTTNTFKVTDGASNTATCAFTVTVSDTQLPTITCPANIAVANTTGQCAATVSYATPVGTDNCSSPTTLQTSGLPSGSSFPVGTTTNTFKVTDGASNTATCAFTVTVSDTQLPTITCPANIAVANTTGQCAATVSYATPAGTDNCSSPTTIQTSGLPSGSSFPVGTTTNTFKVTDGASNTATCAFTVTVSDTQLPTITCPANIAVANTTGLCSAIVSYTTPVGTDNCSSPTTIQTAGLPSGASFPVGATTNIFKVTDGTGNTATCAFAVSVTDTELPTITCPANIAVANTTGLCSAIVSYSTPVGTDNCSGATTIQTLGLPAGATYPVGATTNIFKVTDGTGNTATCAFAVSVTDTQLPTITCPANIAVANTTGQCAATVSYTAPVGTDNCSSPTTIQIAGAASGASYPVGVTTNAFRVTDGAGNTATCAFTVTVNDTQLPIITCPANIAVNTAVNQCSAVVSYTAPVGSDNCSGATTVLTSGLISGSAFPRGVTTNTFTVTAGNGQTAACSFTVTVTDNQAPVITCPANQNIFASGTCTGTVGAWSPVSLSDNCTATGAIIVTQTPPANTILSGHNATTVVTLTANDGNSNTSSCSFSVTLKDITAPVARCKDATVNLGINGSVTVAPSVVDNVSTDNCAFSLTLTPNTFTCANIGLNMVTLLATDAGGNTASCTAKVTIKDLTAPTALCKNATIFLNSFGQATLSVAQVNNGSSDACGLSTMTLTQTQFNCSELQGSTWPVTLSLTDVNGNTASCLSQVTVKDVLAPTAVCEDVTVQLGSNGRVTVFPATLADNSYDNCSVWSYSPTARIYNTSNIGNNNLTITVKDWSGNPATCVSVVTVLPFSSSNDFQQGGVKQGAFEFAVFPNPTSGEATVAFELPVEQAFVVRVFDMAGRLVYSRSDIGVVGENSQALSLGGIAAGGYIVDFQSDDLKAQKRLVVQE